MLVALPIASGDQSSEPARLGKPASLFSEILDWMLAPMLLMVPLSIATTYLVALSIADAPFDRALEERAIGLGQQAHFDKFGGSLDLPSTVRRLLRSDDEEHVYLQVRSSRGELLGGDADLPPPPDAEPASVGLVQFRNLKLRGERVRVAYLEVDAEDHVSGGAVVQVAETLGNRARLANEIIKGMILPLFVIVPITVVLAWFGLARGVRSLESLQHDIASRRPDDMRPIDPQETPIEVAPLVHSFNQLLERLEANVIDQRRFTADAAHQMRTPLAGLRTQAELALREQDPEELRRGLQHLVRSSVRATHLVEQLLSLARAETSAHSTTSFTTLDLEALAREVMRDWVPVALERGLDLGFEGHGEPVLVRGHPIMLREMLKNLVDNGLRYTGRGGAVTVRVKGNDSSAMLEVEDNGPGIAASARDLIFERFFRVLGSDADGSGLGLAIVREIVRRHEASITVTDANPSGPEGSRGTLIEVRLARERRSAAREDF